MKEEKKHRIPASTYEIHLTNKCNLACTYCFEKDKGNCSMKAEEIRDIIEGPLTTSFYLLGGEPTMNPKFHTDMKELIGNSNYPRGLKKKLWESAASSTSNGTEIISNPELYEKLNMSFQISIDGPKHVNDRNRVYRNGKGSYDRIMENVEELRKNKVNVFLHGVASKNSLHDLFDILVFFFEKDVEYKGVERAIQQLSKNSFMYVIEDDYTDEDIDLAISEYKRFYDYLRNKLTEDQYREAVLSLASKKGSQCGAGTNTLMLYPDGTLYACHRGNGGGNEGERKDFTLGNSFTEYPTNTQVFNNYFRTRTSMETFTAIKAPIFWSQGVFTPQVNYCPATFKEVNDTVFYMPPYYTIFMYEVGNFLMSKAIEESWTIEDISFYSDKQKIKETEEEDGDTI